jgi:hypothetical protein
MVAVVGVGILHAFSSLFAVAILSGTLKAAYSAGQIALMLAAMRGATEMAAKMRRVGWAVIGHADATKQKLIFAIGQLSLTRLLVGRSKPRENRATHLLMPPLRLTNRFSGSESGLYTAA